MPALALAEALSARGAEVSFIGVRRGSGAALIESHGYPHDAIRLSGFRRSFSLRNVITAINAVLAIPRAMQILRMRGADVVVGAGGYVAGPVGIAARLGRRGLLITEADSHLGLTNRLLAPLARRVALAFPIPGRRGRKYVVTGRPVSQAVRSATHTSGRRALGIDPDETVVLIVGGSQGAQSINGAAIEAFSSDPPFTVIHVCGPGNYDALSARLGDDGAPGRYRLEPYLDNLPEAIAAADLVISRAGGSVFEIAAIGRPAILVPYPHATGDHQTKNARWMAEADAAISLPDYACRAEKLRGLVGALLSDPHRLEMMSEAARAVGRPDAADDIAEMALQLAR